MQAAPWLGGVGEGVKAGRHLGHMARCSIAPPDLAVLQLPQQSTHPALSAAACLQSGLPDLNHSDPSVADRLIQWQQWVDTTYGFDGYRIDAAGLSAPVRSSVCWCQGRPRGAAQGCVVAGRRQQ